MSIYFNNSLSSSVEGLYSSSPEGSPVKKGQSSNDSFSWDHDSSYDSPIKNGKRSGNSSFSLDSPVKKIKLHDDDSSHDSPLKHKNEFTIPTIRKPLFLLAEDVEEFPFAMEEENNALAFMKKTQTSPLKRTLKGQEILNIKFSQPTSSSKTSDGIPLEQIIINLNRDGWNRKLSEGIRCVKMPNGELVSMNNRRLYSAQQVVKQHGNHTFELPIVMCNTPKSSSDVATTLLDQMEKNMSLFLLKMHLIKQVLGSDEVTAKIAAVYIEVHNRLLCPEQIDYKMDRIGMSALGFTPQWCIYTRIRVFNANVDDHLYGYAETNVVENKCQKKIEL